ncbi:MAG TPA: helix-turn-helix domain-containing protein, partial [Acidimicrobiales bacterium]
MTAERSTGPGAARSKGVRVERISPPTSRVIAVLDALAARPDDRLSLSDIARASGAAPATCLGILNELARAHYVVRRANKSYSLGPAVVGLGRAASQGSALVELVRPHLVRLSTAQQLPCTFSAVLGEDIVVLDSTEVPGGPAGVPGVGQRYAFVPPSGVAFVAWHDDAVVDEWLRKPPFGSGHVDRDRIWRAIEFCRAHGYMVEAGTEEVRRT